MRLTAEKNPETIQRYAHITPARGWRAVRCGTGDPESHRHCSREKGHRGPHVSHGRFGKVLAVWDRETKAVASPESVQRAAEARSGRDVRTREKGGPLKALGTLVVRIFSSVEEIALVILFIAFVGFAIDWLLRIMGG